MDGNRLTHQWVWTDGAPYCEFDGLDNVFPVSNLYPLVEDIKSFPTIWCFVFIWIFGINFQSDEVKEIPGDIGESPCYMTVRSDNYSGSTRQDNT